MFGLGTVFSSCQTYLAKVGRIGAHIKESLTNIAKKISAVVPTIFKSIGIGALFLLQNNVFTLGFITGFFFSEQAAAARSKLDRFFTRERSCGEKVRLYTLAPVFMFFAKPALLVGLTFCSATICGQSVADTW